MPPFRAVILCNGDAIPGELVARESAGADLVLCADGAARQALEAGWRVDAIIGDMDSLGGPVAGVTLIDAGPHEEQENSDSEKAVLYAIERAASCGYSAADQVEIRILGAAGGRLDHTLANLLLCDAYAGRAQTRLVGHDYEAWVIRGTEVLRLAPGTRVSLIPLAMDFHIVTRGLKWDLAGPVGQVTRGLSNEAAADEVHIAAGPGAVAIIVFGGAVG
jgi:thiamine pyrophosphokinase